MREQRPRLFLFRSSPRWWMIGTCRHVSEDPVVAEPRYGSFYQWVNGEETSVSMCEPMKHLLFPHVHTKVGEWVEIPHEFDLLHYGREG